MIIFIRILLIAMVNLSSLQMSLDGSDQYDYIHFFSRRELRSLSEARVP